MTTALRTALIWHDEVMSDVIVRTPIKITIGPHKSSTFVVPELGLPPKFAIVRPGKRGFLLTLGDRMRGTICIEGRKKDVAEFIQRGNEGEAQGGFRATAIADGDWGVIDLDHTGHHKLFFQFVKVEDPPQFVTRPVLQAGVAGYVLSSAVLSLLWYRALPGADIAEAVFRGGGIVTIALIVAGLGFWLFKQNADSKLSFGFSVLLHLALLIMTYVRYTGENPFVWPGPRSVTGNYLVTRLDQEPPKQPEPPKKAGAAAQQTAAAANPNPKNLKTATKNEQGASGGKGETERARDPSAKDVPPEPPKVALFEDRNRKMLDNIIDRNLATGLGKFTGIKGDRVTKGSIGFGPGIGSGVGEGTGTGTTRGSKGTGTGGGGNVEGDFVTNKGPIDTGKNRPGGNCVGPNCHGSGPKEIAVKLEEATGDFSGLSKEEIDRVVKARAGVFRACYQKELNRSPGIGGKLVINFVIAADGTVKSSRTQGGTLRNDGVESCVKSNINRLKFPAKGGAIVNYPFVFTQGG
ncbi:MAG: AgmX/PglI C-terminal domain-containing protein [Kofleriaceae bacterium]